MTEGDYQAPQAPRGNHAALNRSGSYPSHAHPSDSCGAHAQVDKSKDLSTPAEPYVMKLESQPAGEPLVKFHLEEQSQESSAYKQPKVKTFSENQAPFESSIEVQEQEAFNDSHVVSAQSGTDKGLAGCAENQLPTENLNIDENQLPVETVDSDESQLPLASQSLAEDTVMSGDLAIASEQGEPALAPVCYADECTQQAVLFSQTSEEDKNKVPKHAAEPKMSVASSAISFVLILAFILGLSVLLRHFIFQAYQIPSGSMETTIMTGDLVFGEKVSYYFRSPERGDVVTFQDKYSKDITLIKRVIATEGQVVDLRNGYVYVDGEKLEESYTNGKPSYPLSNSTITYPYTVPDNCVWVMGDNRTNSQDSRYFGAISVDTIYAHAVFVYWPLTHFGTLK